ncbi:MAG: hypothetical protein IJN78_06485 [Clostridia bacterium]|nr:hypothetical protein [Clostridia bacterium]MBQ3128309.1 hypothetical protein [Clostridia bacterium]MBQ7044238.1 hypothetical protein [Clostridia bacterium]
MTKRIILFVASLAVIFGLMASSSSFAWFATSSQKKQSISVSLVSNIHSASLSDLQAPANTIIVQGDNLVSLDGRSAALRLDNKSTTDTQLRISIEYTSYRSGKAEQVIYSASEDDDIVVEFANDAWAQNVNVAGISYFYYMGSAQGSTVSDINSVPSISPSVASIPAIEKIYYKDDVSYAYSGQKINVKVNFESKQADNITWSAIDSYAVAGLGE